APPPARSPAPAAGPGAPRRGQAPASPGPIRRSGDGQPRAGREAIARSLERSESWTLPSLHESPEREDAVRIERVLDPAHEIAAGPETPPYVERRFQLGTCAMKHQRSAILLEARPQIAHQDGHVVGARDGDADYAVGRVRQRANRCAAPARRRL